jgi:glutaredoxin
MATTVTIYGTAWCEVTRDLRIFLTRSKVPFEFRNVDVDARDAAAALTMRRGSYEVPVVVVGERTMRNPAQGVLQRELLRQGLLRAPVAGAPSEVGAGAPSEVGASAPSEVGASEPS